MSRKRTGHGNTTIARKLYNSYGDRVERREWCKLVSPLGRLTQPWLSPASDSSHPLRFCATRASTPDRDADCESCVAPDSPNLSIVSTPGNNILPVANDLKCAPSLPPGQKVDSDVCVDRGCVTACQPELDPRLLTLFGSELAARIPHGRLSSSLMRRARLPP